MTPDKRDAWRARLLAMADELAGDDERGRDGQKVVELDQQSVGRLSRMDALQQQAMAQASGARRDSMARRIAAALERIEDGSFGECLDCGEPIPEGRLEIDPTVPRCVSCAAG